MALQAREKRLAWAVAALGGVLALWLVFDGVGQAFASRRTQIDALARGVQQKRMQIARASLALERIAEWERRSLPRDRELARSLYQNWLVASLDTARLRQVQVEPGRATQLRDVYVKLPYAVRARGSLEQMTRWLAAFYEAQHLHQLRDVTLQPAGEGTTLQLTASVEALVLPETERKDQLAGSTGGRVDEARAAEAVKTIAARNLFAAYVPPPPPKPPEVVKTPPPPPPAFDEAKYTILTSIIFVGDRPQAWLNVRPTKQTLRLGEGDGIEVGRFRGKIVRIGAQEIEIDHDGRRCVVALGKALTQGVELPGL